MDLKSFRAGCQRWREVQGHSPILYVVPLEGSGPDADAQAVIAAFEATGFESALHAGPVVLSELARHARSARASAILLCPGAGFDLEVVRPLVVEVRASNGPPSAIFEVLFVGREPEDAREGDGGVPFPIHPSKGVDRMLWVAQFVARSVGVRPAT